MQNNMAELLNVHLSKHMTQSWKEIAKMKVDNGRLLEKYRSEQKLVAHLRDELKKRKQYERFF